MSAPPIIVWFRQDLRLEDNAALHAALVRGGPVIPVYIRDEAGEGAWPPGGAARWWLHHSLTSLDASLGARGSRLIVARGDSAVVLEQLISETGAGAVYWNRRYEPEIVARDRRIKARFRASGVEAKSFNGTLLFEPHTIANKQGKPFQVFTPFWRHCFGREIPAPTRIRKGSFPAPRAWPASYSMNALGLLPTVRWDAGIGESWTPGEAVARKRLGAFVTDAMEDYADCRDLPGRALTSRLSPYLHFGELGPRQVWAAIKARSRESGVFPEGRGAQIFLNEIGWREFAYHLLFHFPHTPTTAGDRSGPSHLTTEAGVRVQADRRRQHRIEDSAASAQETGIGQRTVERRRCRSGRTRREHHRLPA